MVSATKCSELCFFLGCRQRDAETTTNREKVSTQINITGGGLRKRRKPRLMQMDRPKSQICIIETIVDGGVGQADLSGMTMQPGSSLVRQRRLARSLRSSNRMVAPVAIAQLGNIVVSGTVPCSTSTTTVTAATPVFPNATVLLQCGSNVISSAITNSNGVFTMLVNPVDSLLTLLNSCKLVIPTPLSTCNTSLTATGILQSSMQLLSRGLLGGILGGIVNVVPTLFTFVGNLG
ncbi:hypothetical protein BHM03_00034664 [Ensete ventricosum]|uniref:Phylloplanin n=1 Tax=Ensete ventricosum TaxID=4639 RepID=A0A445MJ49_ENSVE|nr:hypothetical protein BHM03_00034664 [Ensete ventricosum]